MRLVDERLQFVVGAEVRVDLGEVGDPVAVVPGADVIASALHGAVLEAGRHPDRCRTETLEILELLDDPCEVAAVVEALVRRVIAGRQPVPREPPVVVRRVAVGEPVRHDEVEPLLRQVVPQAAAGELAVLGGHAGLLVRRSYGRLVRHRIPGEGDVQIGRQHERDVRPVRGAARAVVLGPAVIDGGLELVAAGRQRERGGPDLLRRIVGEVGVGALRLPVARAADLALQAAGDGHRRRDGRRGDGRQHRGDGHHQRGGAEQRDGAGRASDTSGSGHAVLLGGDGTARGQLGRPSPEQERSMPAAVAQVTSRRTVNVRSRTGNPVCALSAMRLARRECKQRPASGLVEDE